MGVKLPTHPLHPLKLELKFLKQLHVTDYLRNKRVSNKSIMNHEKYFFKKTRQLFKSSHIYVKYEPFRKSKFTLF